jgi:glycerol uptake facilitator-like aquaporin
MPSLAQRAFSEWLGTAFLLAAIVGSGIMAQKLAGGNGALALLCNTLPTGAILVVLILTFGPLSGAHFNPAVSLGFALRGELPWPIAAVYIAAQIAGGIIGVWVAHLMFELPLWQSSVTVRTGPGQWLAEAVATFGLLLTIFGCVARTPAAVPYAVGLYITAAYWFTASTSFANPAVTIARALSDTFAGIAPSGVLAFWRSSSACSRPSLWGDGSGANVDPPRADEGVSAVHERFEGFPLARRRAIITPVMVHDFFARAIALLLIGSLICSPLGVFAASADAQAMSSDMVMDAASDEMPCHKDSTGHAKDCPVMAICMALCCQGLSVSHITLAAPISAESRLLPVDFVRLDGVNFPPPARPPKV